MTVFKRLTETAVRGAFAIGPRERFVVYHDPFEQEFREGMEDWFGRGNGKDASNGSETGSCDEGRGSGRGEETNEGSLNAGMDGLTNLGPQP
ncbi:MAG: hypothetical protein LBM66_06590 [Bifidobacteriaceae bacterium]|jgi:hypothetical protein|nr:hypothetical protein [Bifidobacteriaceae bacterium]